MNITRNNYEEFFMLYADNELTVADRKAVEIFVAANPDVKQELDLFLQFKLNPDTEVIFEGKAALMKEEEHVPEISLSNYESFFVLYADDELANDEKASVEDFVYRHPQLQSAFELLQEVKLSPDTSILFANKKSLYRKEKDDRVIPFAWWKLAVAAMVLLMAGLFWLSRTRTTMPPDIVKKTQPVTIPQQPSLHKEETVAVVDTNRNTQPEKVEIATTTSSEKKPGAKVVQSVVNIPVKKNTGQKLEDRPAPETASEQDVALVERAGNRLQGSAIASVTIEPAKKSSINTGIAAAASKTVKDQQLAYSNPGEENKADAAQAVVANSDKLEVLNTSVDTKSSLRGFFRKASRLIAKKTNTDDEDSKHKSILIGGFEIAVR